MRTAAKAGIAILVVVVFLVIGGAYGANIYYHRTFCQGWKETLLNESHSLSNQILPFDYNKEVNTYNTQCSTF